MESQGFEINENVIFHENQSAMLLENNGMRSRMNFTKHMRIIYILLSIVSKNYKSNYQTGTFMFIVTKIYYEIYNI